MKKAIKRLTVVCSLLMLTIFNNSFYSTPIITNLCNNILYVGGSGANNYTSIQEAINDALPGDIIFVYDDSSPYYENLIINKSIKLIGENRETTIIDGKGTKSVIEIVADNISISNFSIRNSSKSGCGICIMGSYNLIYSCDIYNNGHGIVIYRERNRIIDCKVFKNSIGIEINDPDPWVPYAAPSYTVISNCEISSLSPSNMSINIYSSNNVILNCKINQSITLSNGANNTLTDNTINGSLKLSYCRFTTLRNNTINGNFWIRGITVEEYIHEIDDSNRINGKKIYYLYNRTDVTLPEDAGYVIAVKCKNITIQNIELNGVAVAFSSNILIENCSMNGIAGLYVYLSHKNKIANCSFNCSYPICIDESSENHILNCEMENSLDGIEIKRFSHNNLIRKCYIEAKYNGIFVAASCNNTISNCHISGCEIWGLNIDGNNNTITNCNITKNGYGIFISGYHNKIYSNNFISNNINAFCYGWHIWNTREGGNYWDNYRGFDINKDGAGEIPYHIRTDITVLPSSIESFFNFDWRPLMYPVKISYN